MKITILGSGYVGLVSGTCFSEFGFDVCCVDKDSNKINNLKLSNNQYLSNIEFINQAGESVYNETAKESDQIVQVQNILSRTLIAWLGIIVLLAVTGIFI